jgi:hypothetical protein
VVCIEKRCGSILRSPNTTTLAAAFSDHWRLGLAAAFRDVSARNMIRDLPHCAIVEACQVTLELPMPHSCKVGGSREAFRELGRQPSHWSESSRR